jgi:very-short-patch-repair endonuclease
MDRSKNLNFKIVKMRARELRSKSTPSEILLWKELRNRKLSGYKFLCQHPIVYNPSGSGVKYFVADFYCDIKKTVIELDGPIHENNSEYDQFRDAEMVNLGLQILRIKNEELPNIDEVLKKIETSLNSRVLERKVLEYSRNWIICPPLFTK